MAILHPLPNPIFCLVPHLAWFGNVHTPHLPLIQWIPDGSFWKWGFRLVLVSVTCHSCQNLSARRPEWAYPKTKCDMWSDNREITQIHHTLLGKCTQNQHPFNLSCYQTLLGDIRSDWWPNQVSVFDWHRITNTWLKFTITCWTNVVKPDSIHLSCYPTLLGGIR